METSSLQPGSCCSVWTNIWRLPLVSRPSVICGCCDLRSLNLTFCPRYSDAPESNVHIFLSLLPSLLLLSSLSCPPSALSESPPAAMFLLCAVKVPDAVTEMMMAEFHHQEAGQRINSVLKFYTLWRFRYQVWPRMEEGAQQIFKVQNDNERLIIVFFYKNISSLTRFLLSFRSLHPASTSRCRLPYWECLVSPYSTPPGCPRTQAASRTRSMKTSL